MLWQRIITVLILLPLVVIAIFVLPIDKFSLFIAAIILIGCWEWTGFIKSLNSIHRYLYVIVSAGLMWLVYANSLPFEYWNGWLFPQNVEDIFFANNAAFMTLILGVIWWVIAFVLVLSFPRYSQAMITNVPLMLIIGWLILIPTWVAITGLRSIGIEMDLFRGSELLLFVLFIVWAADTGAFFSGKLFGKHKLAPQVSPKKTWEGIAGGVLLSSLIVYIGLGHLSIPSEKLTGLLILAVLIVIFSVIGDLTESIFKRLSGVKDSGHILPGHGGILDRIDALTSTMPLALLGLALLGIK